METKELQERPSYIKSIEIIGIFNRFDIVLDDLQPGINILHGENGCGKTTILHILVNALNGDYGRFLVIDFNKIKITFNNDSFIQFRRPSDRNLIFKSSNINRELEFLDDINKPEDNQTEPANIVQEKINAANKRARSSRLSSSLNVAYFPAFRSMIEAWSLPVDGDNSKDVGNSKDWQQNSSTLQRELFGDFIPDLRYLSPSEIEKEIFKIFQEAKKRVIDNNQKVLSKSFKDVLSSFSISEIDDVEIVTKNILQEIKKLSKEIAEHPLQGEIDFIEGLEEKVDEVFSTDIGSSMNFAINALKTYQESLQDIVNFQNELYKPISSCLQLVNANLNRKTIDINSGSKTDSDFLNLKYLDGNKFGGIQYLSSGERQIFTLIYAVTHISSQDIILIDEPEISIHINTQIELLKSLSEILSGKQIIVCTHSPTIAGEEIDRLKEVELLKTDTAKWDKIPYKPPSIESDNEQPTYATKGEDFGIYTSNEVIDNKE
jgi:ABC-type cobalamin/Fe3+-siderophores transport system ATPase subunit